ncbi:MAG: ANTAR domain-containing protein [Actinomycetota bacterium]|nr:ANTAR domain-containing protein [Actinomycetota bacterium]
MSHDPDRRVAELESELDGLRRALRTRATIEQAMGVLVVLHRCSPNDAFHALVRLSQQYNTKLHRVAHLMVDMFAEPSVEPLDAYLRRKTSADEPSYDVDRDAIQPDPALVGAARDLVAASGSPRAVEQAVNELYRLLVERGWVPPYEIIGAVAGRNG